MSPLPSKMSPLKKDLSPLFLMMSPLGLGSYKNRPVEANTESPALSWVFLFLHVPPRELKRSVKGNPSWRRIDQRRRPGAGLPVGVGQLPAPLNIY